MALASNAPSGHDRAMMRLWRTVVFTILVSTSCTLGESSGSSGGSDGLEGSAADNAVQPRDQRPEQPPADDDAPDIILINLDDADLDLIGQDAIAQYFPNIAKHLQDQGLRLDNLHVVDPLCGPSRASLFRGQYPHNTGIELNALGTGPSLKDSVTPDEKALGDETVETPTGSWEEFLDRGYANEELGVWLQRAGYHTALVGKYHHTEFPAAAGNASYVPPGWHDFRASTSGRYYETVRFVNGERLVTEPGQFRTDVEAADVKDVLTSRDPERPLFLYVAPFGPHASGDTLIYASRHEDAFADAQLPKPASYNETDFTDKAAAYSNVPPLTAEERDNTELLFRDRLRSMAAIDDMIGELFRTLEVQGTRGNTIVMLTSDNGFLLGHHRMLGKLAAFDRSTRVGLLAVGPGIEPGISVALLAHIDITATILELAGAPIPDVVDGRSFVPLLYGQDLAERPDGILIENRQPSFSRGQIIEHDYVTLRLDSSAYVQHASGNHEFYDLAQDPDQLDNQYNSLNAARKAELASRVEELRLCAGAQCWGGEPPAVIDSTLQVSIMVEANTDATDSDSAESDSAESSSAESDSAEPNGAEPDSAEPNSAEPNNDDDAWQTLALSGQAKAAAGLKQIELTIRSESTNGYWNGERLVPYPAAVVVAIGGSPTSHTWTESIRLPLDRYWIGAVAIDVTGSRQASIDAQSVSPGVHPNVPIALISSPQVGANVGSALVMSGTVRSALSAPASTSTSVFVRVQRTDPDIPLFWDGEDWIEEANTWVAASVDAGSWTFGLEVEAGTYNVVAYASVGDGSSQTWAHGRPSVNFTVL